MQFTRCGRFPISAPALPDIPACHICLPHLAHPLAAVWENCRRWDANYNAELHR